MKYVHQNFLAVWKKLGKKIEIGTVDAGNKVAKPTKKVISKIPKPIRDVLQNEAQGLIDTTGTTLGQTRN